MEPRLARSANLDRTFYSLYVKVGHISTQKFISNRLWVSGITSWATESYFTNFLSVAVHRDLPTSDKCCEVRDFSQEVIPLTHIEPHGENVERQKEKKGDTYIFPGA